VRASRAEQRIYEAVFAASQARTFFASVVKDAYFWSASVMVGASVILNKVRRTIGMVIGAGFCWTE
jgi:hypothetical protein